MTPEERLRGRKEILEDVKRLLGQGKIVPTFGYYFSTRKQGSFDMLVNPANKDGGLQGVLQNDEFSCSVCALGALFVGYVDKFNEVEVKPGYLVQDMLPLLRTYFADDELSRIEKAFESQSSHTNTWVSRYTLESDPKERLLLIVNDLLENGTIGGRI